MKNFKKELLNITNYNQLEALEIKLEKKGIRLFVSLVVTLCLLIYLSIDFAYIRLIGSNYTVALIALFTVLALTIVVFIKMILFLIAESKLDKIRYQL